jgi:hypothetical protein
MLKRPLVLALVLGIATSALIGFAGNYLPYSSARDAITDALSLPGGIIASLIYPEGAHTRLGSPNWAVLAMTSNFVVYALFWYICLIAPGYFWRQRHETAP